MLMLWHPKYSQKQLDLNPMLRIPHSSSLSWLSDKNHPVFLPLYTKPWILGYRPPTCHSSFMCITRVPCHTSLQLLFWTELLSNPFCNLTFLPYPTQCNISQQLWVVTLFIFYVFLYNPWHVGHIIWYGIYPLLETQRGKELEITFGLQKWRLSLPSGSHGLLCDAVALLIKAFLRGLSDIHQLLSTKSIISSLFEMKNKCYHIAVR